MADKKIPENPTTRSYEPSGTGVALNDAQNLHFKISQDLDENILVDFADGTSRLPLGYLAVNREKYKGFLTGMNTIIDSYIKQVAPFEVPRTDIQTEEFEGTMSYEDGEILTTTPSEGTGGNVVGPSSAINNAPAIYDSVSGKILKDSSGILFPGSGYADFGIGEVSTSGSFAMADSTPAKGKISLKAPVTVTTPYMLTFPATPPTVSSALVSDASGILSWGSSGSGGGSGEIFRPPYITYDLTSADSQIPLHTEDVPSQYLFVSTSDSITLAADPFSGTPPAAPSEIILGLLPDSIGTILIHESANVSMNGSTLLTPGRTITFIVIAGLKYVEKCRS